MKNYINIDIDINKYAYLYCLMIFAMFGGFPCSKSATCPKLPHGDQHFSIRRAQVVKSPAEISSTSPCADQAWVPQDLT